MKSVNYAINDRALSVYAPTLAQELAFVPENNYLFDTSYLSCVRVEGDKGREFLQGQLSCDIRQVSNTQMRHAALCNLKGRVLALLDVVNWPLQEIVVLLPHDLMQETLSNLSKTAILSRVKFNEMKEYQCLGLYRQTNDSELMPGLPYPEQLYGVTSNEHCCCYAIADNLFMLLIKNPYSQQLCERYIEKKGWKGSLAWHALMLKNNLVDIYPSSRGVFLPHRLGLQQKGYLSFDKGCYKGQEIIARTHFRATLKHELKLFTITTSATLYAGQKLFRSDKTIEIGELVDFSPSGSNQYLIAVSILLEHPEIARLDGEETVVKLISTG